MAGLKRFRQIAKPDSFDDTLDGTAVSDVESSSTNLSDFFEGLLSQLKRIIHGDDSGNWHDDPVSVFGSDVSLKALLTGEQTVADVDLYVRAADGDDDNPGTSVSPLETLQAAVDLLPNTINHTVIIHVGPHAGNGYDMPVFKNKILNANIWVISDGGGGGTDGFTEIVSSTAALAGSTNISVRSSGLSDTEFDGFGEHFGRTIEILTGDAAGDRRSIHHNDTQDIVVNLPFSATISEDDTYRIVEPETIIYISSSVSSYIIAQDCGERQPANDILGGASKINFANFKFDSSVATQLNINSSAVGLYGIELVEHIIFVGFSSGLTAGTDSMIHPDVFAVDAYNDLSLDSNTEWRGWGLTSRTTNVVEVNSMNFYGVANCYAISFTDHSINYLVGGSFWGLYPCVTGYFSILYIFAYHPMWFGASSNSRVGLLANYTSFIDAYAIAANAIYLRAQRELRSRHKSHVFIENMITDGFQFECSTVGFQTEMGGIIHVPSVYPLPTMNCGGNDFSSNWGESFHTISELVTNAQFISLYHGFIGRY